MGKVVSAVISGPLGLIDKKLGKIVSGVTLVVIGAVTGNFNLIAAGLGIVGSALKSPKGGKQRASATTLQIGEVPRQFIVGRAATAGSLVDAFNYGGKYGTDWEVLVLALADHRCDALEGFYVNDQYVAYTGDGNVAGFNNQLQVFWRPGTETQTVPTILTTNGPGWTANDNGAGVAYVVFAYKADAADAKNPVWPSGRPKFLCVVRGALCYDPRKDSTAGGSGVHRWADPATWEWSENPIDTRYKFARGFYACDRVTQPDQLLGGRGLSATEAPPANLFHRANLCDELVDGEPRYTAGGLILSTEQFIEVENDFAAACAGTIVQPEGAVEIDPGEARAAVVTITDKDLVVGSKVRRRWFKGVGDRDWVNTVVSTYIEPTHKWQPHAAPVRRDVADVIADRGPREESLQLGFVQRIKQAGRIAEIFRRLGRLPITTELVLPPRFAALEEGDWIVWQSDRYLNGAAYTFRVESWGSNAAWHHNLSLRQISASCYSDTAPLDNGSVAVQQPARIPIGAPSPGEWSLEAGYLDAGEVRTPALLVRGRTADTNARFVKMEYRQGRTTPDASTVWSDAGITGPDVRNREIPVAGGGIYRVAISYVVDGVQGDRLILGPVATGGVALSDGTPIEVAIEDKTPPPTIYANDPPTLQTPGLRWIDTDGNMREYIRDNGPLFIGGNSWNIGGQDVFIPYWRVGDHAADNTALNAVQLDYDPPRSIMADANAAPLDGQFPARGSIRVLRAGASIKTSDMVTFAVRGAVNLDGASVNSVAGDPNKGDWVVSGMSANSGRLEIDVLVEGVLVGTAAIPFAKAPANAPQLGGSGAKSAAPGIKASASTTAYTAISDTALVTVASGETIHVTGSLDYWPDGRNGEFRTAELLMHYSSDGVSWNGFPASNSGSTAQAEFSEGYNIPGEPDAFVREATAGNVTIDQAKAGLSAGDWYVRADARLDAGGIAVSFAGPINIKVN